MAKAQARRETSACSVRNDPLDILAIAAHPDDIEITSGGLLIKMVKQGKRYSGKKVVCVVTGNGLKDPDIPVRYVEPFPELPAELAAIEKHLGLKK